MLISQNKSLFVVNLSDADKGANNLKNIVMKFKDFKAVEQVEICSNLLKANKYPQYKDIEFAKEIKSIRNIGRFFDFMEETELTSFFAICLFIESEGMDKKEQEELKAKCLEFNRKCKINLFKF